MSRQAFYIRMLLFFLKVNDDINFFHKRRLEYFLDFLSFTLILSACDVFDTGCGSPDPRVHVYGVERKGGKKREHLRPHVQL